MGKISNGEKKSAQWTTSIRHLFIVNDADKNNPLRSVCAYQCEIETPRAIVGFAEIDQTQRSPPSITAQGGTPTSQSVCLHGCPDVCRVWELQEPVHGEGDFIPEVVALCERSKEIRILPEGPSNE